MGGDALSQVERVKSLVLIALALTACNLTEAPPQDEKPVCHEYGFSPTTGRDSSWVVICPGANGFTK